MPRRPPDPLDCVATCPLGLEELLAGELLALGVAGVAEERGAVRFRGSWVDVARANVALRTANRVLVELATFNGHDGDALEAGARNLVRRRKHRWGGLDAGDLFHPERTFALQATSSASEIRDTRWVVLKVKDGIVDGQRDRFGERGSVAREGPDVPLRVYLHKNQATLLLDTSGEPLDRRGYRLEATEAPLREHLAAACVLAAGQRQARAGETVPVVDPMCGSGTLLVEAALVALGRPPGAVRRRSGGGWAFESLPGRAGRAMEHEAVRALLEAGAGGDRDAAGAVRLFGVDRDPDAVAAARANLERAGLAEVATVIRGDGFAFDPATEVLAKLPPGAAPGLVVTNPPYGERLAADQDLWRRLGDLLKQRYTGWRAAVLAGGDDLGKSIGLKPRRRWPVRNGPLEARILVFDLY